MRQSRHVHLAALILNQLRQRDGVSEEQSNAWILEGGQKFDGVEARYGTQYACDEAEKAARKAASTFGQSIGEGRP